MRRIVYLTAVPGQKTGTATYFELFMGSLGEMECDQLILTDTLRGEPSQKSLFGIDIIDFRLYRWHSDDIVVCFVANNDFHAFVQDFLIKADVHAVIVSIIHDPQIFMLTASMCVNGYSGLQTNDFEKFVSLENVASSSELVSQLQRSEVPEILKYTLCCQSVTLAKSRLIIVHSHYARLKFWLEHHNYRELPPIWVGQHPKRSGALKLKKESRFVIGCFGWISVSKRPEEIVCAFSSFVAALSNDERRMVELKFVGQLTARKLNPKKLAKKYKTGKYIRVCGYVDEDEFRNEIASTNLILNLRYPSCGETSGTFFHAIEAGIAVAISDYQAFSEEPATCHISLDPAKEQAELVDLMTSQFRNWKNSNSATFSPPLKGKSAPMLLEAAINALTGNSR